MWALQNVVLPVVTSVIAAVLLDISVPRVRNLSRSWRSVLMLGILVVAFGIAYVARQQASQSIPSSVEDEAKLSKMTPVHKPTVRSSKKEPEISPEERFWIAYVGAKPSEVSHAGHWGVVLAENGKRVAGVLDGTIVEILRKRGYKAVGIFRPAIFASEGINELYGADSTLLGKLKAVCDGVVVGDVKEHFSGPDEYGVLTSEVALEMRIFSTRSGALIDEFQLSTRGGGFSREVARKQANERLAAELKERLSEHLP